MKGKGIVVELEKNHVIVMTANGRIMRTKPATPFPDIGEEVTLRPFFEIPKITTRAAAILLFFLLPILSITLFNRVMAIPVAYVTVDINPSIQLSINNREQVIDYKGINPEGDELLQKVIINKLSINNAIAIIVEKAEEMGYIESGRENSVTVSIIPLREGEKGTVFAEKVREGINISNPFKQSPNVTLNVNLTDKGTGEKALKEGISPARLSNSANEMDITKENKIEENKSNNSDSKVDDEEKNIPPGQVKKEEDNTNSAVDDEEKNIPPGQIKKEEDNTNSAVDDEEKNIPPGQIKKEEDNTNSAVDDGDKSIPQDLPPGLIRNSFPRVKFLDN